MNSMKKYRVWKTLSLEVTVEAESEDGAIEKMIDMDDLTFTVTECDYGVIGEGDQ